MFETFQVKKLYVAVQAAISLYATGRTTGIVCDIGDGSTCSYPVFEGISIPHAMYKTDISGRALSNYMSRLLLEEGEAFNSPYDFEIVRDIKEKICYVA